MFELYISNLPSLSLLLSFLLLLSVVRLGGVGGSLSQLILILLPEAVTGREEVPASLLVHLPHVRLLSCMFCFIFIDEIHQEEHVVG